MSVAVNVENLEKQYGNFPALKGVSLTVEPGELVALLGPSGSGKTTLLRAIAGLEQPDRGRVLFGEIDATQLSLRERRIGFVFQQYALFKHLRVADNIAFGLRARPRRERPPEAQIKARVEELLDLLQLSDLGGRFPAQLSGGQRQRVALARALAIEPRVLLLDEPFGALDAKVRKDLRRWLRGLHDRTGHTTLFVTHDQEEALELADRVAILHDGRIEQVGTPDEIYDQPATPFVHHFLGETNTLAVEIAEGHAVFQERRVFLVNGHGPRDGHASLFVRPHHFEIVEPADHRLNGHHLPGIVAQVRRNGLGRRAEITVSGTTQRLEVDLPDHASPVPGQEVGLAIARASVFASAT